MYTYAVLSIALILCASSVFGLEPQESELCICPDIYQPLCGFNGLTYITYPNRCEFSCAQKQEPTLTVFTQGTCPSTKVGDALAPQRCFCTREFRPICSSDGQTMVTFPNKCEFECAQKSKPELKIINQGEC